MKKVGKENLFKQNVEKAARLYAAIDASGGFFKGTAVPECRSDMNVTFRIFPDGANASEEMEKKFVAEATAAGFAGLKGHRSFVAEATAAGFAGLKGHRSVGGLRASIYNAFPPKGVDDLVAFMADFQKKNG